MENTIINIDSRFRDKRIFPNASKFIYTSSEKIKNVKYIRVSSVEFPNSYFTFSQEKGNTSFIISADSSSFNLLIEDGMYTQEQMIQSIRNELNIFNTTISGNIDISYNSINGFVSFWSDVSFNINFTNSTRYESLGYQLGFRKNTYNSKQRQVGLQTYYYIISEAQLDITGDNYIFLRINDYGVIHHDFEDIERYDQSGNFIEKMKNQGNKNIIAKIILNRPKLNNVFDNGANLLTKSYVFRQPQNLNKFDIEVLDPKGNVIDMLYMNFSLTLEVGVIYDSSLKVELEDHMTNTSFVNNLLMRPFITTRIKKEPQQTYNLTSENEIKDNIYEKIDQVNSIFENKDAILPMKYDKTNNYKELKAKVETFPGKRKSKKKFIFDYEK